MGSASARAFIAPSPSTINSISPRRLACPSTSTINPLIWKRSSRPLQAFSGFGLCIDSFCQNNPDVRGNKLLEPGSFQKHFGPAPVLRAEVLGKDLVLKLALLEQLLEI